MGNVTTLNEIKEMVKAGTLKESHTVRYSWYVRRGEVLVEDYSGRYGQGYKVYEHMVGGSNLGDYSKCWLTYYLYTA